MKIHYVVYYSERLRDGFEEGAKIFPKKEDALEFINDFSKWIGYENMDFKLFYLGEEIALTKQEVVVSQPAKKTISYRAK